MEMDNFGSPYQQAWPPAQATVDVVGSVETCKQKVEALEAIETPARRRQRRFGKVRVRGLVVTVAEEGRS
uniref:Uncharacterized protein n=1 Tax=Oryza rufipogon TaxID=4529 RepID=A0A0E0N6F0_ORYRU